MIVVVGVSHHTAPIGVREQIAISAQSLPDVLADLVGRESVAEALVLSTCNRTEVVLVPVAGADPARAASAGIDVLSRRYRRAADFSYTHVGSQALHHLFRMTASLDSMVVGEPQILGQVKSAYELAHSNKTAGKVLHRVMGRAIRAAKRVRTETSIGSGQVSVPSVACDLARQIFGSLQRRTTVLVGSGEMAEAVAKLLRQDGSRVIVVGRNLERASDVAGPLGGEVRPLDQLSEALVAADVVISSTSAPSFVIDQRMVRDIRRARRGRSLFCIDLAVPRDIEPAVDKIDGVFVYNVDDFAKVVAESFAGRRKEASQAELIVAREAEAQLRWGETAQVTPTIVALRERFREVLGAELDKSLRSRLSHLSEKDVQALRRTFDAATNKLLHGPTSRLKTAAAGATEGVAPEQLVASLVELFELEGDATPVDEGDLEQADDASAAAPADVHGSNP